GAGDGQELGQTFNDAEDEGLDQQWIHGVCCTRKTGDYRVPVVTCRRRCAVSFPAGRRYFTGRL
ncbi:MAG: hypothetical protein Q8M64_01380, partial [Methyloversatilis sp.]|nr:hypothetical protein [Methyloversatilis sp.]